MKHTIWYLDQLHYLLANAPREIRSSDDRKKALQLIEGVKDCDRKLRALIDHQLRGEHMIKLYNCNIGKIPDWSSRVDRVFDKLDQLIMILDEDVNKLAQIVQTQPENWARIVSNMSFGLILAGLHEEEDEMKEFRKAIVFEEQHLNAIVGELKSMEDVL